ncbi:MAG TPA: M20/M25/M40 family metallo-hydrolase [Rudaea sp.]|nr:M20/M25/M40 family metallo-hydrolase [Rudaea sp.]
MAGRVAACAALIACTAALVHAAPSADEAAFRGLYKELVEINTTLSAGNCTRAAEAMRARLLAAGMPKDDAQLFVPQERPKEGALIAVLHGKDPSLAPILLLAHIDVVEARREDWQRDPFTLVEENGWFYARGSSDDKAMASVFTDSLIRYLHDGFKPRRSIKLALTCGEETPNVFNGVRWLLQTKPEALRAAFALNEGAGGELDANGKPAALQIQAGEKVYQDFELAAEDVGGHSSRPTHENPIVRLSAGLAKLGAYEFPVRLNDTTRAYFKAEQELEPPQIAADMRAVLADPTDEQAVQRLWNANPGWNGVLRTTCVPTEIEGGHAPNALPQHVHANVNCRILPDTPVADVQKQIVAVMGDAKIAVKPIGGPEPSTPPPPLTPQIMKPVREVADRIWPGVAIIPTMSTGATDGRYLNAAGIPTYGLSGMFHDAEGSHAHGLNERIRVKSLMDGRRFLYEIVQIYANQED